MNFKKDILLVDLEFTGLNPEKNEIIQMAAVLLDKKTLKEKTVFCTYIKPAVWKNRDPKSMAVNGISFKQLKDAPSARQAISEFSNLFPAKDVILTYYGGPLDMDFMRKTYGKLGLKFAFDYHYFNLWGLFYAYLASKNKLKNAKKFSGFSLDDFMKIFNLKSENRHDALADCRIEAEIFRRVMKDLS